MQPKSCDLDFEFITIDGKLIFEYSIKKANVKTVVLTKTSKITYRI